MKRFFLLIVLKHRSIYLLYALCILFTGCNKGGGDTDPPPPPGPFNFSGLKINGAFNGFIYYNIPRNPVVKFSFSSPINRATVGAGISLRDKAGTAIPFNANYENGDSTVVIQPSSPLEFLTKYILTANTSLASTKNVNLQATVDLTFTTIIDSSRKFPLISDNALLDLVQQQTFKYFWDFGHPVSGLSRERNSSGDLVTSGGSGFGVMAIITGIHRGFITRAQGLARMQIIVNFLKNTAQKFHGAYPHWLNGATGVVIPFSAKDNGADLVETSYLIQGLLCARQYFNDPGATETTLRNDINTIWQGVEWNWFRNGGQNVLYWHWSPNFNWEMNLPIRGWNECLITYVLAASSPSFGIPPVVYTNGWKGGTGFVNGNSYFGYLLPLGPPLGGPLFFSHYSFLGIDPNGLADASANYSTQTKNHTLINYNYCRANPKGWFGYSDSVWGLTASDIEGGYAASSPSNDLSVIAPTAALSSMPFTPNESMAALKFYYYVLGNKIWKEFGFTDAFSLHNTWFANSFLAIDQGPIIIMLENYRSGLLWDLFTSCPEVKTGMLSLGFNAPYL